MKNLRFLVIFLTFLGVMICYLDRTALSYAIVPLKNEFHLNNGQFGILLSCFGFGYIITNIFGGYIADKFGSKLVWGIAGITWSLVTILFGMATGFTFLVFMRVLLGLAEGPVFPSVSRTVADWLPLKEKNIALSLGLIAVPISALIGAPVSTYLIVNFGWQYLFYILGTFGIVWSIIWLLFYTNKPIQHKLILNQELEYIENGKIENITVNKRNNNKKLKQLLTNKTFLINCYAYFCNGYMKLFIITWLPGYIIQTFHIKLKDLGIWLTIPWLLSAILMVLNGWIADKIFQKTRSFRKSRSFIIAICLFLTGVFLLPLCDVHSVGYAIIYISIATALTYMPDSCLYSTSSDLAPGNAGLSIALMNSCLAFASIIVPIITGYLSLSTNNFKLPILIIALLNLSAGILVILFHNPDRDIKLMNG